MDIETKIKDDMKALGCHSDLKMSLAYNLYIHLVDEKLMYDTEYCYNKDIDTLYIVARPNKNEKLNIYVPIPTYDEISVDYINKIQENICTVETGPTVNLAFIEGDYTTVIYTFTKGIVDRPPPDKVSYQRAREGRRNFIDNELKKSRNVILNDALNGGVVDDDDCHVLD
uniref:tRNA-splicing endonuclease subunit Sen15 domain-containing protein n=1 Tax=Heliothis virescens TaxID=7102 RepID=A0A2A4J2J5_HELVI